MLFVVPISLCAQASRTTLTLTDKTVSSTSYTDKEIIINGQTDLHLTNAASISKSLLNNSIVKLNSLDSWLFFDNVRPQFVIDSLLRYVYVNGQAAVLKTNVRVSIYKHGAVVIPHASTFQPMKVYTGQNFSGDSATYAMFNFYTSLGTTIDNKIRSFKLKRGYMATFATAADGTGYSRVYIADDKDIEISVMPALLDQSISFIRVFDWEFVSKKGWAGSDFNQYNKTNSTWRYDWSAGGTTTPYVEYVPIRQNGGWPGWSEINAKQYVSHVLGFNEPDHTEQSNLTVSQALAQWPDMLRTGLRIGSPACTNFSWLYSFMDSCKAKNYRVDYVALHAYWAGKSPANWYNDLKYIYQRTGRPLWITEWNNGANWTTETWPTVDRSLSTANAAKQLSDIKAILNVLDTASFIERYSVYNWVQDCRAIVLADTLTPAGKYYAADKPAMAFNRKYEVIPTFVQGNPSLTITFSTKTLTLSIKDPNAELLRGFILDKKTDSGNWSEFYRSVNSTVKTFVDTLDFNAANRVRYRVRSILVDGSVTGYSNETGYDVTTGNENSSNGNNFQYGTVSFSNIGWNPVYFKKAYTAIPSIILGAPTNNNNAAYLVPRAKLVSASSRFTAQVIPWSYQGISTLTKDESIPYFVSNLGNYDFGTLKAVSGKAPVLSAWTPVTFATAFDTVPVVFVSQLSPANAFATTVRVRNITKTGFEAKLQKETAVTTALSTETVSYFAITPGKGSIDNKKVIVGRTADKAIGTSYNSVYFGDSIANPIFIAQMQTCNDDTITASLRCLTTTAKFANVVKQRERSTGAVTAQAEMVGWMVINPKSLNDRVDNVFASEFRIYPNPARNELYIVSEGYENTTIEIYNMLGVLVKRQKMADTSIHIADLQAGSYVIKTSKGTKTVFVKQ